MRACTEMSTATQLSQYAPTDAGFLCDKSCRVRRDDEQEHTKSYEE